MKRILIAIPVYQYPEPICIESVINLTCILKNKYDFQIKFITGYSVDKARNDAMSYFLSTDNDYLLFIDGDIIINESAFEKLMDADKGIVTGVYKKKSMLTDETTIFKIDDNSNFINLKLSDIPQELFEIDACGFGCVLIKRDIVRTIMEKTKKFPFKFIFSNPSISEDIYFCNECNKNGIEIWCDGTARVLHIGKFNY